MLFLRLRTLATGRTGARPLVAETIAALLDAGVTPLVPEHGSLGASGDLAPLAHCALTLIGEGEVLDGNDRLRPAAEALAEAGIEHVTLTAKEGLALVNGTDGILGMLVLALEDLERCRSSPMSPRRCRSRRSSAPTAPSPPTCSRSGRTLARLRAPPTSAASSRDRRSWRATAPATRAFRTPTHSAARPRCTAPPVTPSTTPGRVAGIELGSAIDNPVVMADGRVESCGNFHGAPLGYACDFLAVAVADVGAMSERRTDRLLDATRSHGLAPFLAADPGIDSGLMLAQYTQAAMVAENRRLAVPASADTLPTSAMQEDHVSMAWGAARKLRTAVANLRRILAVELVAAARGLDLRAPLEPAAGTGAALAALRRQVPGPGPDRQLAPELSAAEALCAGGELLAEVERAVGPLG